MKKLVVTIIAGVCLLGFASCEQDQVLPNGNETPKVLDIKGGSVLSEGPVSESSIEQEQVLTNQDESINKGSVKSIQQEEGGKSNSPIAEPTINIAFDIQESIQSIED